MTRRNFAMGLWAGVLVAACGRHTAGSVLESMIYGGGPYPIRPGVNEGLRYGPPDEAFLSMAGYSELSWFGENQGWMTIRSRDDLSSGGFTGLGYTDEVVNDSLSPEGYRYPSYYFAPSDYPAYRGELCGAFLTVDYEVIGPPFAIGEERTIAVPEGAYYATFGFNEASYDINGNFEILVFEMSTVPEPGDVGLAIAGLALGVLRRPARARR